MKIKMNEYKNELKKYHGESIFSLEKCLNHFKSDMTEKHKIVFDYLVRRLEEEKIIYKYSDNFYIILKNTHYFYFELYDDMSVDYTDSKNKQVDLKFNYKIDVDKFIKELKEMKE